MHCVGITLILSYMTEEQLLGTVLVMQPSNRKIPLSRDLFARLPISIQKNTLEF
jgi:hypothetical protein